MHKVNHLENYACTGKVWFEKTDRLEMPLTVLTRPLNSYPTKVKVKITFNDIRELRSNENRRNTTKRNSSKIKALTALLGRLSLTVGWENGPERGLETVSFNP